MRQRIWTISTLFSFSRVILIAPMTYCLLTEFPNNRIWASGFALLAIATDFLDGYLARRLHEVTEFGKIIDPLADKIAVGAVVVMLFWLGDLPLWYLTLILVRDLLIFAGGVYIKNRKGIVVQSNMPGKIAVGLVALVLLLTVLQIKSLEDVRQVVLWASVAMMVFSFAKYIQRLFIGRNVNRVEQYGGS